MFTNIFRIAALPDCMRLVAILGKGQYSTGESCERGRIRDTKPVRAGAIEDIGTSIYIPMDAEHLNRAQSPIQNAIRILNV